MTAVAAPPEVRRRGELGQRVAAAWLVLLGLAVAVVGGHDALAGYEIAVRLVGILLLSAGLLLIAGGAALLASRSLGPALALLSALVGVGVGTLLGLTQVANDEPDRRLAVWAGIVVLSAVAALVIRSRTPAADRDAGMWSRLPMLKSVVSLGLLISAGQFWYGSIHVPASAPPSLTVELRLEPSRSRGGMVVLEGTATIHNTSGTKVNTLGSVLEVWGQRVDDWPLGDKAFMEATRTAADQNAIFPGRFGRLAGEKLVLQQPLLADGTYLEPGERIAEPIITWVPKGRFDVIDLWASISVARGRTLELGVAATDVRSDRVSTVAPITEAGWLRALTRGDRFVHTERVIDPRRPSFGAWVSADPERRSSPEFEERMGRFYGIAAATGRAFIPLPGG